MSRSALAASVRYLRKVVASPCHSKDSDERLLHAFLTNRDETAFAALVRRYGPMVAAVCRRVLGHQHDAEDAFQATFLVLAQKAARLRKKTALASFLHGTAYRISLNAKRTAARRRKHEGQAPARASRDPLDELSWREVRVRVDEEVARLPEKYRSAFILCCLESVSQAEAAQRLGLKEGTLSSRLMAARKRLGQRLARRGVDLSAVLAAMALTAQSASALSPLLITTTIKTALATAASKSLASGVSASVTELVHNATATMMVHKTKIAALLLLAATLAAGAGMWTGRKMAIQQPAEPQEKPRVDAASGATKSRAPGRDQGKDVTVSGRVVDPEGKPVRGAKLGFIHGSGKQYLRQVWAISAADGRFAFTVPRGQARSRDSENPWKHTYVLAAAEGFGFAVARLGKPGATDLTLRLAKDDVPIRGRILDLQGKPVAGARIRIYGSLYAPEQGNLTAWFTSLKEEKRNPLLVWYAPLMDLSTSALDALFPPVITGPDGRFCFKGIGPERIAYLRIEGPEIATQTILVMTRPSETIHLSSVKIPSNKIQISYFGATFDLVAAPTRPIVGVVRDKDTGKPLTGITIGSEWFGHRFEVGFVRAITDKDGRYRLVGVPKRDGNKIAATTNELPYLAAVKTVGNPLGLEPIAVDFALKRGLWVKGRVTEKGTAKPLSARVQYYCFRENSDAKEVARLLYYSERYTEEDGTYRLPVLPGRGLIAVRARQDHYVRGVGAEDIKNGRMKGSPEFFDTEPTICAPASHHALAEISPKSGEESMICNMTLVRGRTLKGKVLDPDGKPLAGASVSGLRDSNSGFWLNAGAEFTVESLQPNQPRVLQFMHEKRKLAGGLVLHGDEKEPISLRLQPWGVLTGRVVSPRGEPLSGTVVHCRVRVKRNGKDAFTVAFSVRGNKDGRFRIEGLVPDLTYHDIHVAKDGYVLDFVGEAPKNLTLKAGETKDLADLTVKPRE